jgi:hypothetical protein
VMHPSNVANQGVRVGYGNYTTGNLWLVFAETFTFTPNVSTLILRRTAVAGISTYFDMVVTRGSTAATTGVVNTVASATEIPWTRTAGGTALHWISPRFTEGYVFDAHDVDMTPAIAVMWLNESNLAANVAGQARLYRWRAGVETLCWTSPSTTVELTTTAAKYTLGSDVVGQGGTIVPTVFLPDDRIVFRAYAVNFGVMGGARTATITYDHNVAAAAGDSYLSLYNVPTFKAEGDLETPTTMPDGMPMSGIGN